ncbi:MAG: hypothetical protein HQK56_20330, partial [Deltaproteobacteria bacterium]|nr:hypothetical protein [Deltaproteobacteria bacterium]
MANILIVDDDATILLHTKKIMAAMGHGVEIASSGIAAVEKVKKSIPDLIL